ncbi:MAG: pre-peptidase C-terminal domain-containing protein [Candidatus Thorarchaeota archaeon]
MRVYVAAAALVIVSILVGGVIGYFLVASTPQPALDQNPEDGTFRFTGTLSGDDDYLIHSFRVNGSATSMHVTLTYGFNDFDLYCAQGYTPSEFDYDWRGYESGGEDLTFYNPEMGIWHVMVHSYSGAGDYSLNIDITYE